MIRWIAGWLGTAAREQVGEAPDLAILDVRDMVDKRGNGAQAVREKLDEAKLLLGQGRRVVVCCDYGMSRSNAIAAGILSEREGIPFEEAVRRVVSATGEKAMKIEVLSVVRRALASDPVVAGTDGSGRRRIVVTGQSGLLGRGLVGRLAARHDVLAPSRAEVDLLAGATDLALLAASHQPDLLIHLANPRVYTINRALGETLVLLKNVLDVCQEYGTKLLYLSGWEVYSGYQAKLLSASESLPRLPQGTYGEAKHLAETLIEHHVDHHGLGATIIRSSPVYGGDGDRPKFIYHFLGKARRDEDIVTHSYRNGPPHLDLLHLDDLLGAIERVVDTGAGGAFNLGTGVGTSTADVAERIVQLVGSESRVRQREIEGTTANVVMDTRRAQQLLGWAPRITLDEGLRRLVGPDSRA